MYMTYLNQIVIFVVISQTFEHSDIQHLLYISYLF